MIRTIVFLLFFSAAASCSKKYGDLQPVVIPGTINGVILDIKVTPIDISTPDKASLRISMNNVIYSVEFNAAAQSQSNATILFASKKIQLNVTGQQLLPDYLRTHFISIYKDASQDYIKKK